AIRKDPASGAPPFIRMHLCACLYMASKADGGPPTARLLQGGAEFTTLAPSPPERSFPEVRARLFQPAAQPHGRDAAREPGCIVGLDRERTQGCFPGRGFKARARNPAQDARQRLGP